MNPLLSGVQRGKEIAKSLVDALCGISIKVIGTKSHGEYRINLSEIVVSKLFFFGPEHFSSFSLGQNFGPYEDFLNSL